MENMIGSRIRQRRKELNITQTEIQRKTSISSGNLSSIENGRYLPSAIALIELSTVLDCSVDWILTGNSSISKDNLGSDIKENSDDENLLNFFHGMMKEDQEELLMLAQMKYERAKRDLEREKLSISPKPDLIIETA